MQKYRHGWSDTSFNNLLCMLPDTIPEGNKVAANTYRANRMIRPVVMKLKIFHASTNHCILYLGQYGNLQSCPHCGASWNKRKAGYRTDMDDEGPKRRQKKKKTTTKQILFSKDEEEEGYMQRKSPALSVWYLPMIDCRACAIWEPRGCQADIMACIGRLHQGQWQATTPLRWQAVEEFQCQVP